ncbi:MAG: hypothetical protein EOP58_14325 [Sphingomonadales bacterium]|nr:MAG: hypothetical protein EOP58_14325 [Sphingomonadales bacterium]
MERRSLTPTVFHHGNRGMTRDRILAEHALFLGARAELADPAGSRSTYHRLDPVEIHNKLRSALLPGFDWLNQKAPARIPFFQGLMDYVRLTVFVLLVVFALSLPGLIVKLEMPWERYLILLGVTFAILALLLKKIGVALPGTATPTKFSFIKLSIQTLVPTLIFFVLYVVVAAAAGTGLSMLMTGRSLALAWKDMLIWLGWGMVSLPVTLAGLVFWLRSLERADASQDAPPVDPLMLREMARREDWIPQNHMGSLVLIKPGILRMIIIRAGHHALGLALRIIARNGYLGSMRTIHFAHWAMVNNKSRLMFFSNFDQTWESYLDDFIEKAHAGLTLAWCCGVGFPPTRFLVKDGASHGRQFKEWARHSMTVSRFWYSAYKDLTAEQIERNFRIACGLRKPSLSAKEAAAWINDL